MPSIDKLMVDVESWSQVSLLQRFLAERLTSGHLLPCLGSGISFFADLPNWEQLLEKIAQSKDANYMLPPNMEPYSTAENILQDQFSGNRQEFLSKLHMELYRGKSQTKLASMVQSDVGMRALAMLCFRSVRGGSKYVLTFNYDDILELMLRDLGVVCESLFDHRFMFGNADVSVLHPHGMLPINAKNKSYNRTAVVSQSDAQNVYKTSWGETMNLLLTKHFPLFVGIGGRDIRLLDYLDRAQESNYLRSKLGLPFIGLRICSKGDKTIKTFESKFIKCIEFDDIAKEWPLFVAKVCQIAAKNAEKKLLVL